MYGRVLFVALGLVAAVGTAVVYLDRRQPRGLGRADRRHGRRVRAVRRPDLPTARAAHERASRGAHHARLVRARVRGPRLPTCDRRRARRERARRRCGAGSSSTTSGSAIRRASEVSLASLEAAGTPGVDEPERLDPARRVVHRRAGRDGRARRAVGRGQDDDRDARAARLRRRSKARVRVDGHDVRELTQDSLHAAVGLVAQDPHLFHDTIRANLRFARPDATDAELEAALPRRTPLGLRRRRSPTASTPSSASAAIGCRAARSNASRSRACC